jgi:hypothetical protein
LKILLSHIIINMEMDMPICTLKRKMQMLIVMVMDMITGMVITMEVMITGTNMEVMITGTNMEVMIMGIVMEGTIMVMDMDMGRTMKKINKKVH